MPLPHDGTHGEAARPHHMARPRVAPVFAWVADLWYTTRRAGRWAKGARRGSVPDPGSLSGQALTGSMSGSTLAIGVRKPRVADVPGIKRLIDQAATQGALLPRTTPELFESVRDFHVCADETGVVGCCALHIDLPDLAEVRSLVVREDLRGRGMGIALVQACLEEARTLGISRVYALTRAEEFFTKQGFHEIDKHDLPNKVFRDCVRCPMFPDCDEVAVVLDLDTSVLGGRRPEG